MPDADPTDDLAAALSELHASAVSHDNDALVPPGQRPCPICARPMQPLEKHRTQLDVCPDHGVWLDQGELATILERAYWYRRDIESRPVRDRAADRIETNREFLASLNRVAGMLRL